MASDKAASASTDPTRFGASVGSSADARPTVASSSTIGSSPIRLSNLTKFFPTKDGGVTALEDISLDIEPSSWTVLLGRSGCGKSTILRLIAGLTRPTTGSLDVGKSHIESGTPLGKAVAEDVGFVFQEANLLPWRKISANIALPMDIAGIPTAEKITRTNMLAKQVGLEDFLNHYPKSLSGGMRQRVALARTLAQNPSILLLDEPFGALDAMTRDSMNILVQNLWTDRKPTTVLVTHSITEAVFLADRVVVLSPRPGRIRSEIEIPFSRPRSFGILNDSRFAKITGVLRKLIEEE